MNPFLAAVVAATLTGSGIRPSQAPGDRPSPAPPRHHERHGGHGPAHGERSQAHGRHGNPADLSGYIARQESAERNEWQKPEAVIAALALSSGQTACDIGAGPGYFSLRLARAVAPGGQVYAVDVEPEMVSTLRERLASADARNVTPVLSLPDDPLLADGTCDLILIVNTYHHFDDGVAYLARLRRALRPGGRLVNVDFHKRETPFGPRLEHRVDQAAFLEQARRAGYAPAGQHDFLPYQYFLVLRVQP